MNYGQQKHILNDTFIINYTLHFTVYFVVLSDWYTTDVVGFEMPEGDPVVLCEIT